MGTVGIVPRLVRRLETTKTSVCGTRTFPIPWSKPIERVMPALQKQPDPGGHLASITPAICDVLERVKVDGPAGLAITVGGYGGFEFRFARKSNSTAHDTAEFNNFPPSPASRLAVACPRQHGGLIMFERGNRVQND